MELVAGHAHEPTASKKSRSGGKPLVSVSDFTGSGIEPKTSRADNDVLIHHSDWPKVMALSIFTLPNLAFLKKKAWILLDPYLNHILELFAVTFELFESYVVRIKYLNSNEYIRCSHSTKRRISLPKRRFLFVWLLRYHAASVRFSHIFILLSWESHESV